MLSSIRKFSSSIYSKIFLAIVAIPFVFWGMGNVFTSGSKNIVVKINKSKYSTQDFASFVETYKPKDIKITPEQIDKLLSTFIGNKLIEKEYEYFNIKLSDLGLTKLIKNQKEFKRENKFSRTEYEKFLISNNLNAATFESNLKIQEKKKQFLDFIGGGITPSKSSINAVYNSINQKREVKLINLNKIFNKDFNFSQDQISVFYEDNKSNYNEIYKSFDLIELNPKTLIENDEYTDIFFNKIDDIDNNISQGRNMDYIISEYNLIKSKNFVLNKSGKNLKLKKVESINQKIIETIFLLDESEKTALIETENKFFILELVKTENIQRGIDNLDVQKDIIDKLKTKVKRKYMSEIVSKINKGNFAKSDFYKLSSDENVKIEAITINTRADNKILKEEIINQIYAYPEERVIIVNDIFLKENFLVYINKVINVFIDEASNEYEKYADLTKQKVTNELFNTYDKHIKNKYKIDINYNALNTVKNYFK